MAAPTPNQGLILPVVGDLNAVPSHFALYNAGVENRLIQRYDNAVDRSVRNPAPNEGEVSYLRSEDRFDWRSGGIWRTLFSGSAWTAYVPIWGTTGGSGSSIGNGSLSGRFQQVGRTVNVKAQITMGSTTTYGTSQWTLSLPVPAVSTSALRTIFHARVYDNSPSNAFTAMGHVNPADPDTVALEAWSANPGTDAMRQNFPIIFASGDLVTFAGSYEAA